MRCFLHSSNFLSNGKANEMVEGDAFVFRQFNSLTTQ